MLPTTAVPVCIPAPLAMGGRFLSFNDLLSSMSLLRMLSADVQAWCAWCLSSSGAFQNAMMASPMYLST